MKDILIPWFLIGVLLHKMYIMKKSIVFQMIATVLFTLAIMAMPVQASGNSVQASTGIELPGLPSDTIVSVVIVKIDLTANSITLRDGSGKLWIFVVDPQYFDLSRFKVGQKATATISRTLVNDNVTRARITKMQLIKLQ